MKKNILLFTLLASFSSVMHAIKTTIDLTPYQVLLPQPLSAKQLETMTTKQLRKRHKEQQKDLKKAHKEQSKQLRAKTGEPKQELKKAISILEHELKPKRKQLEAQQAREMRIRKSQLQQVSAVQSTKLTTYEASKTFKMKPTTTKDQLLKEYQQQQKELTGHGLHADMQKARLKANKRKALETIDKEGYFGATTKTGLINKVDRLIKRIKKHFNTDSAAHTLLHIYDIERTGLEIKSRSALAELRYELTKHVNHIDKVANRFLKKLSKRRMKMSKDIDHTLRLAALDGGKKLLLKNGRYVLVNK